MHRDVRFTLAVEFVHPGADLIQVAKRLLRRVKALKIQVKRVYLDKGFCSISDFFIRTRVAIILEV